MLWLSNDGQTRKLLLRRARIADAPAIARVYVDSWRMTYDGLLPRDYLDGLKYDSFERHWRRTLATRGWAFVAETTDSDGGDSRIVGMASGGRARRDRVGSGEIYVLYLEQRAQGRGAGRALFDACHYELARRGLGSMFVWVLAANPSRYFYEHIGGIEIDRSSLEVGGQKVEEIGYYWPA